MTDRASVNWRHPPKVQIGGALQSTFQQLHYLFDSDHGLNMFEQDFCGCSPELQISMRIMLWGVHLLGDVIKEFPTLSRVCHSHPTS